MYFRNSRTIELYKNKMDKKVIKSHQCSLKISNAVLPKINSEINSSHKKLQTQNN